MDLKLAATVFGVVFLARVLASAIGVLAGGFVAQYITPKLLSYVAGVGFVIIGLWTIWQGAASA